MSAWEIALDAQIDLRAALSRGDVISGVGLHQRPGWTHEMVQSVFAEARATIAKALPVYVASDVTAIWQAARASFAPEVLHRTDLMFPVGFGYIEGEVTVGSTIGPFIVGDEIREPVVRPTPMELVLWSATEEGVAIYGFAHRNTLAKYGFQFDAGDVAAYQDGEQVVAIDLARYFPMMLTVLGHFTFEKRPDDADGTDIGQTMQVLWALMREFVPMRERVARHTRHRAVRAQMPETTGVSVVRLRRRRPDHDNRQSPQLVAWDHRWVVRGHWRNQWHPSLGVHRQRWVAPYVKGPEGLPLVVTDKAVEFVR